MVRNVLQFTNVECLSWVGSRFSLSTIECRLPVSRPSGAKFQRQESVNDPAMSVGQRFDDGLRQFTLACELKE